MQAFVRDKLHLSRVSVQISVEIDEEWYITHDLFIV